MLHLGNNWLFCLSGIKGWVIVLTLWHKVLNLFRILHLIVVAETSDNSGIVGKLKDWVGIVLGHTVCTKIIARSKHKALGDTAPMLRVRVEKISRIIQSNWDDEIQKLVADGSHMAKIQKFRDVLVQYFDVQDWGVFALKLIAFLR